MIHHPTVYADIVQLTNDTKIWRNLFHRILHIALQKIPNC
jgi:hypothetical protein